MEAVVDYAIAGVEQGEKRGPPIPPTLLVQVRTVAREGVSAASIAQQCIAGGNVILDHLMSAARESGVAGGTAFQRLQRDLATLFEQLTAELREEHSREGRIRLPTAEQQRARRIKRLLAGELIDVSEFAYDFSVFHLGVVAAGSRAERQYKRCYMCESESAKRRATMALTSDSE